MRREGGSHRGRVARQSGEWGSNPRSPASRAGGLPLSYPLNECDSGVFLLDEPSMLREVRPGIEPGLPRLPGRRAAATLPDQSVAEVGFEPTSNGL